MNKERATDVINYRLVSLTSMPGKIIEWILLKEMLRHMGEVEVI